MGMVSCCHCGDYFIPNPRQKNSRYCNSPACQRGRKAAWQREKMHKDSDYRGNQKQCRKDWCRSHSDYWKEYRQKHPEQAKRNRDLQHVRNRKRNVSPTCFLADQGDDVSVIAKMDALKSRETAENTLFSGQFWLVPMIAKMDALKVNIYRISACCK
jgi:hypothetical protein